MDGILDRGLRAFRRRQQRLTDEADRQALARLVDAHGGRLALSDAYPIAIERVPDAMDGEDWFTYCARRRREGRRP